MKVHANPWAVLILNNIGGALVVALLFGFPNLKDLDQTSIQVLLVSGFFWTLASYTDIKSHEHLEVALSGLYGTLRYVLLVLASVFILGETISFWGAVGCALITFAVLMASDFTSSRFRKGSFYRVTSIFLINTAILIDKSLSKSVDPHIIVMSGMIIPGIIFSCFRPQALKLIIPEIKKSGGYLALAPIFQGLIYFTYVYSFSHGDLITTATIGQTAVIYTYVLGILLLKEKDDLLKRGIASFLCLVGAALVALKV